MTWLLGCVCLLCRYCECFAGGFYCNDECGCMECNNTKEFEVVRGKVGRPPPDTTSWWWCSHIGVPVFSDPVAVAVVLLLLCCCRRSRRS